MNKNISQILRLEISSAQFLITTRPLSPNFFSTALVRSIKKVIYVVLKISNVAIQFGSHFFATLSGTNFLGGITGGGRPSGMIGMSPNFGLRSIAEISDKSIDSHSHGSSQLAPHSCIAAHTNDISNL